MTRDPSRHYEIIMTILPDLRAHPLRRVVEAATEHRGANSLGVAVDRAIDESTNEQQEVFAGFNAYPCAVAAPTIIAGLDVPEVGERTDLAPINGPALLALEQQEAAAALERALPADQRPDLGRDFGIGL